MNAETLQVGFGVFLFYGKRCGMCIFLLQYWVKSGML